MSDAIVPVTDDQFESSVLQSDLPTLVEFWAEWCGPCKMLAPVLEEVAKEFAGRVKIVKLDIEENPQTPVRYGIRSIPTLLLYKNGEVEGTKIGSQSKASLIAFLQENI